MVIEKRLLKRAAELEYEPRTVELTNLRTIANDDGKKIRGHLAVFNSLSEDLGGFREIVAPGAFKKTLKEADIRGLFNHDANYVLGRNKSGTLRMKEDKVGLDVEIDPPDTQWARDLIISIDRGDIDQGSFAFRTIKDSWNMSDEKNPIRTLEEVALRDVSIVTYPAYPETDAGIRENDNPETEEAADGEPETLHSPSWKLNLLKKRQELLEKTIGEK
jgi:uncharacterized protein